MGWKKWFINISDDEKWLIFMIENSLKIMRNGWWKIIYKYDWDLKMTYENKWEWKANYKYKWDNFLDYDMKNHDIHENKNVCPEFNGEKMHEQNQGRKSLIYQGFSARGTDFWYRFDTKQNNKQRQECKSSCRSSRLWKDFLTKSWELLIFW